MAIPFFILAGTFLTRGGVARRMIAFTTSWSAIAGRARPCRRGGLRDVRGDLGLQRATVVAIGSIMMPAMVEHGYPKRFGVGVISTSGALGILVPPSIILVLYGVSTNTSIGALFMAGIVPGHHAGADAGGRDLVHRLAQRLSAHAAGDAGQQWTAFRESMWGLLLIVHRARRHLWRHLHADRGRRGAPRSMPSSSPCSSTRN